MVRVMTISKNYHGFETREEYNIYCREYYQKNKAHILEKRHQRSNYGQTRQATKKCVWKLKLEVLTYYSTKDYPICTHCGETDIKVLQVDHISGGGNQHKKSIGGVRGSAFYYWLRKQGFPEGYQVLCANCNIRKKYLEYNLYVGEV